MPELVTPKRIALAYAFLRECHPFCKWNLPPADKLRFEILNSRDHAEYDPHERRHVIRVNALTHIKLEQLLSSTAHEMVHLRQELIGRLPIGKDGHNADFRRMARQVCHHLGFNLQSF